MKWKYLIIGVSRDGWVTSFNDEGKALLADPSQESTYINRAMKVIGENGWELVIVIPEGVMGLVPHGDRYIFKKKVE
ncbi:MAG TPA: hypothetical protein PLI45_04575 [Candidatus Woesebacteria bacterium]|nr:hypothetical protein [Candidatus Woesebacteria bacterium]